MRFLLLFAALTIPVLAADKVSFGKHDRFSLEFPDGWNKPGQAQAGTVVYREHADGGAAFSVSRLYVRKGARVDLQETLKAQVSGFRKSGMTVVGDIKGKEGMVDGKESVFAQVPVKLAQGGQNFDLSFFMVIVDCRDQVLILQATLPNGGNNKVREDCRNIIGSLHEADPAEIKKRAEEARKGDEDEPKEDGEKRDSEENAAAFNTLSGPNFSMLCDSLRPLRLCGSKIC